MTPKKAYLPYKHFIFAGKEVKDFLQGQLTQDLNIIKNNTCQYSAYCDPKGRMLANFLLTSKGADSFSLRINNEVADTVIARLTMFKLRAKLTIEEVQLISVGLNESAAALIAENAYITVPDVWGAAHGTDFTLVALPNNYYELYYNESNVNCKTWLSEIEEHDDSIHSLRLSNGHFNVLTDSYETIAPQQTVLEQWGSISYKKGCYVGQEIIARNKYRGKVTKAMGYAVIDKVIDLSLLAPIKDGKRSVGQVVDYSCGAASITILAIISLDHFDKELTIDEHTIVVKHIS